MEFKSKTNVNKASKRRTRNLKSLTLTDFIPGCRVAVLGRQIQISWDSIPLCSHLKCIMKIICLIFCLTNYMNNFSCWSNLLLLVQILHQKSKKICIKSTIISKSKPAGILLNWILYCIHSWLLWLKRKLIPELEFTKMIILFVFLMFGLGPLFSIHNKLLFWSLPVFLTLRMMEDFEIRWLLRQFFWLTVVIYENCSYKKINKCMLFNL